MKFFIFASLLMAIGLFHQREHVRFVAGLRLLQKKLSAIGPDAAKLKEALKGEDWRFISLEGQKLGLRRAFEVKNSEDTLRYAVPVMIACAALLALESWAIAGVYAAIICVKWFASLTMLNLDSFAPGYEVRLLGIKLFGESFAEPEKKPDGD